jgi:hypothetical protein
MTSKDAQPYLYKPNLVIGKATKQSRRDGLLRVNLFEFSYRFGFSSLYRMVGLDGCNKTILSEAMKSTKYYHRDGCCKRSVQKKRHRFFRRQQLFGRSVRD